MKRLHIDQQRVLQICYAMHTLKEHAKARQSKKEPNPSHKWLLYACLNRITSTFTEAEFDGLEFVHRSSLSIWKNVLILILSSSKERGLNCLLNNGLSQKKWRFARCLTAMGAKINVHVLHKVETFVLLREKSHQGCHCQFFSLAFILIDIHFKFRFVEETWLVVQRRTTRH